MRSHRIVRDGWSTRGVQLGTDTLTLSERPAKGVVAWFTNYKAPTFGRPKIVEVRENIFFIFNKSEITQLQLPCDRLQGNSTNDLFIFFRVFGLP